jgi:hypothetical protein
MFPPEKALAMRVRRRISRAADPLARWSAERLGVGRHNFAVA